MPVPNPDQSVLLEQACLFPTRRGGEGENKNIFRMNGENIALKGRKKNRFSGYDYSRNGVYFVTICTRGQRYFFGKIEKGEMVLNELGKVVEKNWREIPKHFPSVSLGEFVVMPNHMHGIVILETEFFTGEDGRRHAYIVEERKQDKKLFRIIGAFKSAVSKEIHAECGIVDFGWQKSFYDHVIRNENASNRISEYIRRNPAQWEIDKDRDHVGNIEW